MTESEQFSERAAIIKFDGNMPDAERLALLNFEAGTPLFNAHKDDIEAAKNWVRHCGFTYDEVKIVIRGDSVFVVRK